MKMPGKGFEDMEPNHPKDYGTAAAAGMGIQACVLEAVDTLGAPEELRRMRDNFDYDPVYREWGFDGYCFKGSKALADPGAWVQKICDWLQANYPNGPFWAMGKSFV
jgi:hypothetical protein